MQQSLEENDDEQQHEEGFGDEKVRTDEHRFR